MGIKINYNIFSNLVQRNLAKNDKVLSQAYERLSSGDRINRSADDPAGMATSERLRYEIQGVRQNQQNVSSSISLAGTAESYMTSLVDQLQRARELAVQAGNDTLNTSDRQALQDEVTQIMQEVDRTASTATFGDRKLFDGTFNAVKLQVGTTKSDTLAISFGNYSTSVLGSQAIGSWGAVGTTALADGQVKINGVDVPASLSDGLSSVAPAASAMAKAAAINKIESQTRVHATALPAETTGGSAIQAMSLDTTTNSLKINGVLIPATGISPGDSERTLQTAINNLANVTGVSATIDGAGRLKLKAADGRNVQIDTTGNAAQQLGLSASAGPQSLTLTGSVQLTSNGSFTVDDASGLIGLGGTQQVNPAAGSALSSVDITTTDGASKALGTLDAAIAQLSAERSRIGALSNRLSSINDGLAQKVDDLTANDTQVRGADYALEMARATQAQIIQQAGLAMLTQANASPKNALSLLQN